jgi:hypothetical protein
MRRTTDRSSQAVALAHLRSNHQTRQVARDFLTEIVRERTKRNPEFPKLVAEAERAHQLVRELVAPGTMLVSGVNVVETQPAARLGEKPRRR